MEDCAVVSTRPIVAAVVLALAVTAAAQGIGTWATGAPLPSSRTEVAGTELRDRLYVVGGFGGGDQVEAYDPKTDRWERRASLPVSLHHTAAAAVGDHLYVIGGYSMGRVWGTLDTVFEYVPASDQWRERARMPTPRGALAAAVIDGRIYAVGGVGRDRKNTGALE